MKIIVGGVVEKDGKVLLVQEAKKKCYGKWNFSAGKLEPNENIMHGALREIKEETGCEVELTGLLNITHGLNEDEEIMAIIFSTKLLNENICFDKQELLDVKWFDIDEIINNMNDELRNSKIIKPAMINLKNHNIGSLGIINEF